MKAVVQHLSNLIRIPSPSSLSNRPIIDYAVNVLQEVQWHSREIVYRDAAGVEKVTLIAAPPHQDLNDITPELALMCHTDTVPYSADWPQALEPFIADGLLHGCGACDAKGFLACLLTSIAESDPDGQVLVTPHLFEVKAPSESAGPWDCYKPVATTAPAEAFQSLAAGACPFVTKT